MPRNFPTYAAFVLVVCTLAASAPAAVRTVTNTNDVGIGSLRAAISAAVSGDEIRFAIGETGVQTINPATALPPIAAGVTINGISQAGASCAMWPPTLLIELAGDAAPGGTDGLSITGNDVLVRGLVINSFLGDAIRVTNASGVHIECNFIGTDATGSQDYGNAGVGVRLVGSTFAMIGGGDVSQRNLISANAVAGVLIDDTSSANSVMGNYIGTDAAGATRLDNFNGVTVRGASNGIEGNLISGNTKSGVLCDVATATGNGVLGNRIGSNATDTASLPNGDAGVSMVNGASQNTVGTLADGNRFRANEANGVWVDGATSIRNSIRGNSMTENGAIGIALGAMFSENPNDADDPDSGPNRLQNTPVLVDVAYAAGLNQVTATFAVTTNPANASYPLLVDFYGADIDDDEGEFYLGTLSYEASDFAVGNVAKSFTPLGTVMVGDAVVATATDADGNTSEFTAEALTVVVPEPAALASSFVAIAALAARRRRLS
jgi:hypothetical protein